MSRKVFFLNNLKKVAPKKICSRAGNSEVNRQMWPEFELIRDFMPVLVICKFDDDWIKNEVVIMSITFSLL